MFRHFHQNRRVLLSAGSVHGRVIGLSDWRPIVLPVGLLILISGIFPRMPGPTDLVEAMFHSMAAALGL